MQINIHDVTRVEVSSLYRVQVDGFCRFSTWKTITIHHQSGDEIKINVFFSENEHDSNIEDSNRKIPFNPFP